MLEDAVEMESAYPTVTLTPVDHSTRQYIPTFNGEQMWAEGRKTKAKEHSRTAAIFYFMFYQVTYLKRLHVTVRPGIISGP
jgi:hypothetical protein